MEVAAFSPKSAISINMVTRKNGDSPAKQKMEVSNGVV